MVNLASPIVGVPFPVFIIALAAGHLPINFISVKVRPTCSQLRWGWRAEAREPVLPCSLPTAPAAPRTASLPAPARTAPPPPLLQAGHNLATMQSVHDMYSSGNVLFLLAAGALALVPVMLRRLRRTDRAARRQHLPPKLSVLPIIAMAGGIGNGTPMKSVAGAATAAQKRVGSTAALLLPPAPKRLEVHTL